MTGATPIATVEDPGARTTLQDLGRPGFAHLGVPGSGAVDRRSLMLANRLVGNAEAAPALETTLSGPTLRFARPATIALTGARVDALLAGRPVAMDGPVAVRPGDLLVIGRASRGLRTYLAVRGGFDAERAFGSASSDQLTGLGPPPLAAGDVLCAGALALAPPAVDVAPVAGLTRAPVVRVVLGPREDWFAPDAITSLLSARFTATAGLDRIGVRLRGPTLAWRESQELRSEGIVVGSLQVPPDGQPILLLADHPTTGGYPVIAVVIEHDLSLAAQLVPGDTLQFREFRG